MDWLMHQYRTQPESPALYDEMQSLSYGQLYESVAKLAGSIKALPEMHKPGIIAVLLPNSLEYVTLIHAIRWIGASFHPIHASSKNKEIKDTIDRISPSVLICNREHEDALRSAVSTTAVPVVAIEDLNENNAAGLYHPAISSEIASILATSGTSGVPKYVPHTMAQHEASAFASAQNIRVKSEDNWLCVLPLSHAGGLSIVFRSMIYASSMTILKQFNTDEVITKLRSLEISLVSLVPTMLRALLLEDRFNPENVPSLRTILLGGARAEAALLDQAAERGFTVLTSYGMTETASQAVTMSEFAPSSKRGSAGRPLPGVSVNIRDDKNENLPENTSGTIWLKGPMLLESYYGSDPDPELFRDGWFRTGDLGYLDEDGYLWVSQRSDQMIITGGENVDPAEVEDVLRSHPDISDAAVIGVADEKWGELIAAAIETQNPDLNIAAISAFCREKLTAFKVPKKWLIMDSLPRTDSGKVARGELKGLNFVED
jgi:o-succinylbenzoate---CoA ligase